MEKERRHSGGSTFEGRLEPKRSRAGRLSERSIADWSRDKGVGQSGGSEMK